MRTWYGRVFGFDFTSREGATKARVLLETLVVVVLDEKDGEV